MLPSSISKKILYGSVKSKKTGKMGFISGVVISYGFMEGSYSEVDETSITIDYSVIWNDENKPTKWDAEDLLKN